MQRSSLPNQYVNMSFRDLGGRRPQRQRQPLPKVRALATEQTTKRRVTVLHGRVISDNVPAVTSSESSTTPRETVRRQSVFTKLSKDTQHFQKLVTELETVLQNVDTPEASWRAKILLTSARETDQSLCDRLIAYEKTIANDRPAQTACLKLHRDLKRTHRSLHMVATNYERLQRAAISQLGAVGWSQPIDDNDDNDLFNAAMRDREIHTMNQSMRDVHQLYQELAGLVQTQQEDVDAIEDTIELSHQRVEDGTDHLRACDARESLQCGVDSPRIGPLCGCGGERNGGFDRTIRIDNNDDDNNNDKQPYDLGCDWYESLQNWRNELDEFRQDVVTAGNALFADDEDGNQQQQQQKANNR